MALDQEIEKALVQTFKDEQERNKVRSLLVEANRESEQKKILVQKKRYFLPYYISKISLMIKYGLHWSSPMYLVRMARNIILQKIYNLLGLKRFILRGCEFDITFNCNFACSHCSIARLRDHSRKELEVNEYASIVKEAMKLGAVSFGLEGGEPFANADWEKIVKVCLPGYNHIIVTTNGYLFDETIAQKCSKLGVDTINISIDNGIAELHDLFRRKKGSFDKAMQAISWCQKYGLKVIINTVVHKKNLYTRGLLDIIEFAEKNKILIHLLFGKAIGSFKTENDLMLDDQDIDAFNKLIRPYAYAFVHHDTNISYVSKGCNGTKEMLQFTPYGDVMNCANMHVYFGNVREEPLKNIREKALKKTPFNSYRPCFLTMDKDFMNVYYSLLNEKKYVTIDELTDAIKDYERKYHKDIFNYNSSSNTREI